MNPKITPLNFELIPDGTTEYWVYSHGCFHSFTCIHNNEHEDYVQSCTVKSSFHISDLNAIHKHDGTDVSFYAMRCNGNPIRVSWNDRDLQDGKRYWDDAYIFATRNEAILFAKRLNRTNKREIIYSPEWIEKILSGQKTMTIRRTQYPCGIYDVVSETEPDTVVCQIEVVRVEKWETEYWLREISKINQPCAYNEVYTESNIDFLRSSSYSDKEVIELFPCFALSSGFESIPDFIQYHLKNYAPVKYAHTFQLVKGDDNVS